VEGLLLEGVVAGDEHVVARPLVLGVRVREEPVGLVHREQAAGMLGDDLHALRERDPVGGGHQR